MKPSSLNDGVIPTPPGAPATTTPPDVRQRAVEIALSRGGSVTDVTAFDLAEAERELNPKPAASSPEDSLPANQTPRDETNTGHQVPNAPSVDEDAEGRSLKEQLVDKGIARAARDHMVQAAKTAANNDK